MILMLRMHQLMQDDIIPQMPRQGEKVDIEADMISRRAASPSALLIAYPRPAVAKAVLRRQFLQSVEQKMLPDEHILGHRRPLLFRPGFPDGSNFRQPLESFFYPPLLGADKFLRLTQRAKPRHGHPHGPIAPNRYPQ